MMVLWPIFRDIWLASIHSTCSSGRIKRALRAAMRTGGLTLSCPQGEAEAPAPCWIDCGAAVLWLSVFSMYLTRCAGFFLSFFFLLKELLNLPSDARQAAASSERSDLRSNLRMTVRAALACVSKNERKIKGGKKKERRLTTTRDEEESEKESVNPHRCDKYLILLNIICNSIIISCCILFLELKLKCSVAALDLLRTAEDASPL